MCRGTSSSPIFATHGALHSLVQSVKDLLARGHAFASVQDATVDHQLDCWSCNVDVHSCQRCSSLTRVNASPHGSYVHWMSVIPCQRVGPDSLRQTLIRLSALQQDNWLAVAKKLSSLSIAMLWKYQYGHCMHWNLVNTQIRLYWTCSALPEATTW